MNNKQYLLIAGSILAGIILAITLNAPESSSSAEIQSLGSDQSETAPVQALPPQMTSSDSLRINQLEVQLAKMTRRLESIERRYESVDALPSPESSFPINIVPNSPTALTTQNETLSTAQRLTNVGVDPNTATFVAERQAEAELDRLELRNLAIRNGYIGTEQYRDELQSLAEGEVSIRQEVGDYNYDKYLYASGQPNRIAVDSIISGSAADSIGIKDGDLLLSYGGERLFNFRELQSATTEGQFNEPVDITLIRNGSEVNLSIPRGPLGVRLSPRRVSPEDG